MARLFVVLFSILSVALVKESMANTDDYYNYCGLFGVGGGYTTAFIPHKDLENYSSRNGFFVRLSLTANALDLSYHRDYLSLKRSITDSFDIDDPGATLGRLNLGYNIPMPIVGRENFTLAPTVNYGFGGYRMVLNKEALEKLGGSNLTKIHNRNIKFGQYIGLGLTTTVWKHVNLNFSWNLDWVVKDYKWWYIITSSLVPVFLHEIDYFSKVMIGVSFMFGDANNF